MIEDHPLFRGMVGLYGRSCANHVVAEADLVIYAGQQHERPHDGNWKMPREGTADHPDRSRPGRDRPQLSEHDRHPGRRARGARSARGGVRPRRSATSGSRARKGFVDEWRAEADKARASDQVPMRPERLCKELTEVLPKDAILVADTGYAALWTGTLVYLRHATQRYFRAAGSLGWSFPASLGAKCAAPDKPVICFTGDGGFYYHLPELETARRRGINTVTIVNNNHCLAQGVRNLNIAYGTRDHEPQRRMLRVPRDRFRGDRARLRLRRLHRREAAGLQEGVRRKRRASNRPAVIDCKTEFAAQAPLPWVPS